MKLTNKLGCPTPYYNAVAREVRKPERGIISATGLYTPPQVRILTILHWEELTQDVGDMVWSTFGQMFHAVMERVDTVGHTETELEVSIDGWKLTGRADYLDVDGIIWDYKTTSAWSLVYKDTETWEQQLNTYAFLFAELKYKVNGLRIFCVLKDWSRSKAFDAGYPQRPLLIYHIPLWERDVTEKYIRERLALHKQAEDGNIIECADEDRWARAETWAVMKGDRKKALRVCDTLSQAKAITSKDSSCKVVRRLGENVRCENYCLVRDVCPQYKKIKEGV